MSTLTQFLGGKPRRQIVTLTASNASLPIPVWAQGGKGVVRITGCGAGASGGIETTSGRRGAGGGAGAFAVEHPLLIPSSVTTLNCQIGSGGSAVTGSVAANGNNGGNTSVTAGSVSLFLDGGLAGLGVSSARAAYPRPNSMAMTGVGGTTAAPPFFPNFIAGGLASGASSLAPGAQGGNGSASGEGFGAGAWSPFGAGGPGVASATANINGGNADGYGSGGAGALWLSGGNVTSGAGAPGLLILEFVEGL